MATDLRALRRGMAEQLHLNSRKDGNTQRIEAALRDYALAVLRAEPSATMLDRAVSMALNVKVSAEYNWSQYMADQWKRMSAERAKEIL